MCVEDIEWEIPSCLSLVILRITFVMETSMEMS